MQNSSQKSTPRPLVYNNKAGIVQFVMGNASQAHSVSLPFDPSRTGPNFQHAGTMPNFQAHSSLFDQYNRNALLLRDCDRRDITVLHKNLVLSEQPLSAQLVEQVALKAGRNQMASTGAHFIPHSQPSFDPLLRTAPDPSGRTAIEPSFRTGHPFSREFQENQIIFNYGEMAEVKRTQKQQFLSQIEARIAEAERQIADLEDLQAQQRAEVGELTRVQQLVGEQLSRNVELGVIRQKIGQAIGLQTEENSIKLVKIHKEMEPKEINELIDQQIKANEEIFERAGMLRRRSQSKEKESHSKQIAGFATAGFKQTLSKDKKPHKSLASTMKAPGKPLKQKKK